MHRVWNVFVFPVSSVFDTVSTSKVSISLRTSFKNQQSLHNAPLWFPGPFLETILIKNCIIFEYFCLLFRDLFLYSFFYRFWLHFGSKNALSELRQITPGPLWARQIGLLVSKTPPKSLEVTFATSYGGYLDAFSSSSRLFWHDFQSMLAYQMTDHVSHEEIQFAQLIALIWRNEQRIRTQKYM